MKRYILTFVAAMALIAAKAQTKNHLIYKEFEPNLWDTLVVNQVRPVDINDDGIADFQYETFEPGSGAVMMGSDVNTTNGWTACCHRLADAPGYSYIFFDLSIPLNDTSLEWGVRCLAEQYSSYPLPFKVGLRYKADNAHYYGWAEFELDYDGPDRGLFHLSRTCFCAIPDYPLKWGQTSLYDNIEENDEASAAVYPNPTKDMVVVTGTGFLKAHVANALGQQVATAEGDGKQVEIDLKNQPSGIYFVTVTNSEGKKSVKKVVKQ